jgi:hypothetical protein
MAGVEGLDLVVSLSGPGKLFPEQSADFDLLLRNGSGVAREVASLELNGDRPTVRLLDESGGLLAAVTRTTATSRVAGDMGDPIDAPPETRTIAPGKEQRSGISLWTFLGSPAPGRYALEVCHPLDVEGAIVVTSNRVPFEIVGASVERAAAGYEGAARSASVLAWIASPLEGGRPPELLVRLSGFSEHAVAQQGGISHGAIDPRAFLSVGHHAPDTSSGWLGWVAVTMPGAVDLIRHNMSHPLARTGPLTLPVSEASPVPRFPDRRHAVYLATGLGGDGRPALAGVVAAEDASSHSTWTAPLATPASRAACAFTGKGPISLLLSHDDGKESQLSLISVDESGKVLIPERVVRTTPHRVIALAADIRARLPLGFAVLEQDRSAANRVALVRIAAAGRVSPAEVAPLPGWPFVEEPRGARRFLAAAELSFDVALDGSARLALVDEAGGAHAGPAGEGGALAGFGDPGANARSRAPHVVLLGHNPQAACFTGQGALYTS